MSWDGFLRLLRAHNWWSIIDGILLAGLAEGYRWWILRPERVAKRRMDKVLKVAYGLAGGRELFDEVMLVRHAGLDPLLVSQALKRAAELDLVGERRIFDGEWSRPFTPDGLFYCDQLRRKRWYGGHKRAEVKPI